MSLISIFEERNVNLFPLYFWADAWALFTKPILGKNLKTALLTLNKSQLTYYVDEDEFKELRKGLLDKIMNGFLETIITKNKKTIWDSIEHIIMAGMPSRVGNDRWKWLNELERKQKRKLLKN